MGDPGVIPTSDTWGYNVKARHIYEGTDSEEEEPEIPVNKSVIAESSQAYDHSGTVSGMAYIANSFIIPVLRNNTRQVLE